MSTTTLCQRVQHPFDPKLVEPWQIQLLFPSRSSPRPVSSQTESYAIEQNSIPVKSNIGNEWSMKHSSKSGYLGGWSFLQSLSNPSQTPQIDTDTDKVYEHPLAKRSKSALSEKSLEMCTESLGSETGGTVSENEDDIMSSISICDREKSTRSMPCYRRKRMSPVAEFPPPLSTMRSGRSSGVQVESVREDGRLVIKAVNVTTTPQSCFMAERRDGTLKLHFVHDHKGDDDDDDDIMDCQYEDEIESKSGNVRNEMEELDGVRRSKCKEGGRGGGDRRAEMQNLEGIWVSAS